MNRAGFDTMTWQQRDAANRGLSGGGDDEVMEELGIPRSPETLQRQLDAAAEVARLLGIDTRTARERARAAAQLFYAEEFGLTEVPELLDEAQREALATWVR